MLNESPQLTRCLVLLNSKSTNSQRAGKLIDKLERYFDKVKRVELAETAAETRKLVQTLAPELDEHTLICIAGGDGTLNVVINSLFDPGVPAKAQKAVILPLWGGNANDLASMVNGSVYRVSLHGIINMGLIVPIYPMAVAIKHGKVSETRLGMSYVSFGASAYAARNISTPGNSNFLFFSLPGIRLFREIGSVLRAFVASKRFTAEIDGKHIKIYDLILINGSRIAKVYRAPNRLTSKTFLKLAVQNKFLLLYGAHIIHALAFKRGGNTKQSLVIHEPAWMQLDGEVSLVPAHAEITITIYKKPLYVLSTKLKV